MQTTCNLTSDLYHSWVDESLAFLPPLCFSLPISWKRGCSLSSDYLLSSVTIYNLALIIIPTFHTYIDKSNRSARATFSNPCCGTRYAIGWSIDLQIWCCASFSCCAPAKNHVWTAKYQTHANGFPCYIMNAMADKATKCISVQCQQVR